MRSPISLLICLLVLQFVFFLNLTLGPPNQFSPLNLAFLFYVQNNSYPKCEDIDADSKFCTSSCAFSVAYTAIVLQVIHRSLKGLLPFICLPCESQDSMIAEITEFQDALALFSTFLFLKSLTISVCFLRAFTFFDSYLLSGTSCSTQILSLYFLNFLIGA